jgi:hypothetical protein
MRVTNAFAGLHFRPLSSTRHRIQSLTTARSQGQRTLTLVAYHLSLPLCSNEHVYRLRTMPPNEFCESTVPDTA